MAGWIYQGVSQIFLFFLRRNQLTYFCFSSSCILPQVTPSLFRPPILFFCESRAAVLWPPTSRKKESDVPLPLYFDRYAPIFHKKLDSFVHFFFEVPTPARCLVSTLFRVSFPEGFPFLFAAALVLVVWCKRPFRPLWWVSLAWT